MRSPIKKEEILQIIVTEFEKANTECENNPTERNFGKYIAMFDLLRAIPIYPDNKQDGDDKDATGKNSKAEHSNGNGKRKHF